MCGTPMRSPYSNVRGETIVDKSISCPIRKRRSTVRCRLVIRVFEDPLFGKAEAKRQIVSLLQRRQQKTPPRCREDRHEFIPSARNSPASMISPSVIIVVEEFCNIDHSNNVAVFSADGRLRLYMALTNTSAGEAAMVGSTHEVHTSDAPNDMMLAAALLAPTLIWALVQAMWPAASCLPPHYRGINSTWCYRDRHRNPNKMSVP